MKRTWVVVLSFFVVISTFLSSWSEGSDPMGPEITVSSWDMHEALPEVAYNSVRNEYFVVWNDNNGIAQSIMGARYSGTGSYIGQYVIAYENTPVPKDNNTPSVAYDPMNDQYFVVWVHDYYGNASDLDIWGRYVPWNGPDGSHLAFPVNGATGDQWNPRVAYGGLAPGGSEREFLVTWWNPSETPSTVSAQRFLAGGGAQGGVISVSSHPSEDQVWPDIAYNLARNEYMIAYQLGWSGDTDIYGVRLRGDGTKLGSDFAIANWTDPEGVPRISASRVSNTWAVAWHSEVGVGEKDVFACTVSVDGTGIVQLGAPVNPGRHAFNDSHSDIDAHPESSNFVVIWGAQYSSLSGPFGIHAQVFNSGGTLGTYFVPRPIYLGESVDCGHAAVAGGVDDWMVVWEHKRDASNYLDIHARVLFADVFADGFEGTGDTTMWSSTVP